MRSPRYLMMRTVDCAAVYARRGFPGLLLNHYQITAGCELVYGKVAPLSLCLTQGEFNAILTVQGLLLFLSDTRKSPSSCNFVCLCGSVKFL